MNKIFMTEHNISRFILEKITAAPLRPVLEDKQTTLNSKTFASLVQARASDLFEFPAGSRFLVVGGRGVSYWVDAFAIWLSGHTAVHFDVTISVEHMEEVIRLTNPRGALTTFGACPEAISTRVTLLTPPDGNAGGNSGVLAHVGAGDLASIIFTSGSTGRIKGARVSHDDLLGNALATLRQLDFRDGDRLGLATPFNFVSAISHVLVGLLGGASVVTNEQRLLPGDLLKFLSSQHVSCFGGSPLQLRWISESVAHQRLDLRWVMSSGDHLPVSVIDEIQTVYPETTLYCFYGLTEVGGRFCALSPDNLATKKGSVGRPIKGLAVSVRDEHGAPVAVEEIGEVYVSGDYVMDGYHNDAVATQSCMNENGFRTGDMGRLDEDGFLFLVGRRDDVFKTNGQKVSGQAIAEIVLGTGLVADVTVAAYNHPLLGTVPRVLYVERPEVSFDKAVVVAAVRKNLPDNHVPQAFDRVPLIPRTGSGKVKRRDLSRLIDQ